MSSTKKVVFLLHPDNESTKNQNAQLWQEAVFAAATKILTSLEHSNASSFKWNISKGCLKDESCVLNWGHKVVRKAGIKYHTLCDFKLLSTDNLKLFKDEVCYADGKGEHIDYCAHTLAENFTAMAHDFKWEQHEIVSPVKVVKKRKTRNSHLVNNKQKFNKPFTVANYSNVPSKQNIVFIVGPLPKTEKDLENYFEWSIKTQGEMEHILMPRHLALHFRDKHDIRFFWIDSESVLKQTNSSADDTGVVMMEKFLNTNKGCIIPITLLLQQKFLLKARNNLQSVDQHDKRASKQSSACGSSGLSNSFGPDSVFEGDSSFCKQESVSNCTSVLPLSLILSHYGAKHSNMNSADEKRTCCYLWFAEQNNFESGMCIKMHMKDVLRSEENWTQCEAKSHASITLDSDDKQQPAIVSNSCGTTMKLALPTCKNKLFKHEISTEMVNKSVFVVGRVDLHMLRPLKTTGKSILCSPVEKMEEFKHVMQQLQNEGAVLVVRSDNAVFKEKTHPEWDCYAFLQPLSSQCASLSWIRNEFIATISAMLETDVVASGTECMSCDPLVEQTFSECSQSIFTQNLSFSDVKQSSTVRCGQFEPFMLEPWYCTATSEEFSEICDEIKSKHAKHEMKASSKKFEDLVMSELQQCYKTPSNHYTDNSVSSSSVHPGKNNSTSEYLSLDEMTDAFKSRYNQCLETLSSQAYLLMDAAKKMIEMAKNFFYSQGWKLIETEVSKIFDQRVFVSASIVRSRNVTSDRKCAECKLQILLHLEWGNLMLQMTEQRENDLVQREADSIIDLLRVISVSQNLSSMKLFLKEIMLSNYATSCGKILYEVYNDLMLPIPNELQQYDADGAGDDSFCGPPSIAGSKNVPSTGPFSILSSVGSRGSAESPSLNKQLRVRRASCINRLNTRQIVVRESSKVAGSRLTRSETLESVKSRLFATGVDGGQKQNSDRVEKIVTRSSAKKNAQPQEARVERDVGRVRRDLFASPSKSARKRSQGGAALGREGADKTRKESTNQRRLRKTAVTDTPAGKQRMTALARQRLRMRRSRESGRRSDSISETVVEESPMKLDDRDDHPAATKSAGAKLCRRSPRHSVMLTRRHSFYRDDKSGKSRTIARAQIVQLHHEAVPPTPEASRSAGGSVPQDSTNPTGLLTPKSLLFSYSAAVTSSSTAESGASGPQRSRRRLQLHSEALPLKEEGGSEAPSCEQSSTSADVLTSVPEPTTNSSLCGSPVECKKVVENASEPSSVLPQRTPSPDRSSQRADFESALACTTPSKLTALLDLPATPPTPVLVPFSAYSTGSSGTRSAESLVFRTDENSDLAADDAGSDDRKTSSRIFMSDTEMKAQDDEKLITPVKQERRSLHMKSAEPECSLHGDESSKPVGPIDHFVVRTPTPAKRKCARVPTPSSVKSQKKPSPNGDHIQRWPRRKRVLSSLSPVLSSKRRKRFATDKSDSGGGFHVDGVTPLPGGDDFERTSPLSSPDVGVYVATDANGEHRIFKAADCNEISPGVGVSQLLRYKNEPRTERLSRDGLQSVLDSEGELTLAKSSQLPGFANAGLTPRMRSKGTLLRARIGSPSSQRHVQMLLLPNDSDG